MVRVAAFLLALLLLASAVPAHAAKRVALVIGNSAYQHTPKLTNPKNDAADMAAALRKLGFEVIEGFDLGKAEFERKVLAFANALQDAEAGIFFYAGHGLQVAGQNYLVPIDAKAETAAALDFEMVRLDLVHRTMERATNTNILFLDACRDNPLARNLARSMGTRSSEIGRGLAAVESGVGTLISFSTQPGNVALDGQGRNSPFAGALAKHISTSTDSLADILISVRNDVRKETHNKQVPWEHSALTGRFYFTAPKVVDNTEIAVLKEQLAKLESELKRQQQAGAGSAKEMARAKEELAKQEAELRRREEALRKQVAVASPSESKPKGPYDGVWDIHRVGPGCGVNTDKLYQVRVSGEVVGGRTPTGPISGTISAAGLIKFSHTGVDTKGRPFGTVSYTGTLKDGGGFGTFDKPGTDCRGTFTAKRIASLDGAPSAPSASHCDGIELVVGANERRCVKPGAGRSQQFKDCAECPEMVVVPAGRFIMGSPANEPERFDDESQVAMTISKPFAVGRFAVTRGEFAAFVAATGRKTEEGCYAMSGSEREWKQQLDRSGRSPGFAQTDRHPVVCVNWHDAKAYVAWLSATIGKSYRLLSDAEREYVTRAGTMTPYWWGSAITPVQANYDANHGHARGAKDEWRRATVPVDMFAANPWGLYNVHGNVFDWVEDCWSRSGADSTGDGTARTSGDCSMRAMRGGSWNNHPRILRAANRGKYQPDTRADSIGFRVARTLSPP